MDAEQQRAWRAFLGATRLLEDALDRQLQRDAGLPHAYYQLLAMLSEAPGRSMRMSDLAALTQSSQSRLSHAVRRLEEAGWIERARDSGDRRVINARLTDAGMTVVEEAAPGHVEAVRTAVFDPLSDEQVRQLLAICEAVIPGLVEEQGAAAVTMLRALGLPDCPPPRVASARDLVPEG